MSALLSCNPNWSLFDDPSPDMDQLISLMTQRIQQEETHKELNATIYEQKATHQRRFLIKNAYDLEAALRHWHDWVKWRHEIGVDDITEEEIAFERTEGIAKWQGKNKADMKCCVVTARNLDPLNRQGTARSFRRYIIKLVEEGLKEVDDAEEDRICIIYDRRGMTFEHIDPNLYSFCKKLMEDMRWFYSDRVGVIYIMHLNIVFWALYYVLVYPTVGLLSRDFHKRFLIVDKPEDLLQHFNEEELLVLKEDSRSSVMTSNNSSSNNEDEADHINNNNSKEVSALNKEENHQESNVTVTRTTETTAEDVSKPQTADAKNKGWLW